MKISFYTLLVSDYPRKGEHLLYNTRTQALVKINDSLKKSLEEIRTAGYSPEGGMSLTKEYLTGLSEMGFLVQDETDDLKK